MENQRVLLIGGAGYLGTALVEKLKLNNFEITVLLRKEIVDYKNKYLIGDLLDKESLFKIVRNFDVIINLASIIRTVRKGRYQENLQGLKNLIEAMDKNNFKRLIYFSSQNVNLVKKGPYAKSKEVCERLLVDSDLEYMIIRPSIIYGIDKQNDFYRLIGLIRRWHLAPIIGTGANKMQPVFIDDVVEVVVKSLNNFTNKKIIEVVGQETVSMNQVIDYISQRLKISPVRIHLPLAILKIFKRFVTFDLEGYDEDRISRNFTVKNEKTFFFEKLDGILNL